MTEIVRLIRFRGFHLNALDSLVERQLAGDQR